MHGLKYYEVVLFILIHFKSNCFCKLLNTYHYLILCLNIVTFHSFHLSEAIHHVSSN